MKPLFIFLGLFSLFVFNACNNDANDKGNGPQDFREEKYPVTFNKNELILDTINYIENKVIKLKNGFDSLQAISRASAFIAVPKRTLEIKWYTLDYAIDGRAYLTVITSNDSIFKDIKIPPAAVAATAIILQNSYVRFDTSTLHLIAYKVNNEATKATPFKIFDSYLNVKQ